jgi:hypothetical protein
MARSRRITGRYAHIVMQHESVACHMVELIDRKAAEEAKRQAEARRKAAGKRRIYVR